MIILGSREREKLLGTGQFDCPNCRTVRQYRHVRVDNYFALYFIPLFKVSTLAEYVQCQVCHNSYDPAILTSRIPSPGAHQPPVHNPNITYCPDCGKPSPSGHKFCWNCGQPLVSRR